MNTKIRLIVMNFLQYGVWGAYLTSMGSYLEGIDQMSKNIGTFYAMQGIVSLFMPALIGIVADRWVQAQKLLGICHAIAAIFMFAASFYALQCGSTVAFAPLFTLYTLSVAFYMPTISLSNSVAYSVLNKYNLETIKHFPSVRIFGTVGFICAMLLVNFAKYDDVAFQNSPIQFCVSGVLGLILALYAFTLPACETHSANEKKSLVEALGLRAFVLFKEKKIALFFIFSILLGALLQITNGYANPFIRSFGDIPDFANSWGARNANALISLSQMSETLCILLIPFFLKRFGIKKVMLMSMLAWVFRFGLFGVGDTGSGVWMFILSMIIYGIAFDFFNISGSLFIEKETDHTIRSAAQGLFMMMTNGVGATIGMFSAQAIVNRYVHSQTDVLLKLEGWETSWFIFAGFALAVAVLFTFIFKYKHENGKQHIM